jgi:hypothetical protein
MFLLLTGAAYAQISTGNVYGTLVDESGAVLPGAHVTISGENGTQSVVADQAGNFRFLNLDNGTYRVTVQLTGFSTLNRDVRVTSGENVNLTFNMKVTKFEDAVTISAETPVVDTKKTGTGTTIDHEELSEVPNSRDPWAVLRQVPGVLVDRLNQAGTQSGQQSGYSGKGSSQQSSMWVLDGVVITDPGASGASPFYYNFDDFDEVTVTTGGADIRVASGGVGINIVTKRGTNNFHGGARGFFTDDSLQSSNVPSSLIHDPRLHGSTKADHARQIGDYGAELGGPLVKDKLWFYGSYGHQDIRILKFNQVPDKTILNDYSGKLNWQASPNDMVSAFYYNGVKEKYGRPVDNAAPPLSESLAVGQEDASHTRNQAQAYDGPLHGFFKGEWNHVFSPQFLGNVKYAYLDSGFTLAPVGGAGGSETVDLVNSIAHGSSATVGTVRPTHNVTADFNYFAGHHELKFGFGYRKVSITSTDSPSGNQLLGVISPVKGAYAVVERGSVTGFHGSLTDFYVGDTYAKDRLTINAGARFDHQTAANSATSAAANASFPNVLPALSYDGAPTQTIKFSDISPRLGITSALDDSRKTVARGSFAIFTDQINPADVSDINPVGVVGGQTYRWNDLNGDGFVQPNEVDLSTPNIVPPVGITPSTVNQIDPNLKARRDLEVIVGIDREVAPNFMVSANYTFRRTTNNYYSPFVGVNGTDWVPCAPTVAHGFTAPCQDLGAANLASILQNGFGYVLTNRPDYSRHYSGAELTAVKRLSNKWLGRVSFSYNDWTEYFGSSAGIQDPNPTLFDTYGGTSAGSNEAFTDAKVNGGQLGDYSAASGNAYWISAKWQLSADALYQLPQGFEIAGNLFARQGYIRPFNAASNNTFGENVLVAPIGDNRLPNIWNLDLRLSKNFAIGGTARLILTADAFNVFNSSTTLRMTDAVDSAVFSRINEIMNPRLFRFGLRLTF